MNGQQPLPASTRIIYAAFDSVGRNKARILAGGLILAVAGILASGFYVVKKEERGVLVRFGKVVDANVGPGLHYRIPIADAVHIRKIMRVERQRIASRDASTVYFSLLSGDTNLLEVDVILQYRINNLRNYLYATSDPHKMVAMFMREHLVDIMGQNFIDLIFTLNRNLIEQYLLNEIVKRLRVHDVGLEPVSLSIVDIQPVAETRAAFHDVSDAIAERLLAISNANQRKERLLLLSRGQAEALLMNAKAKANERIVQARSSARAFSALLAEYRERPNQVAITRYWQRMRTIFAEAKLSAVNPRDESASDVNVIDGPAARTPAGILAAPSGKEGGKPALTKRQQTEIHAIENIAADKPLVEGRFHNRRTERDHMEVANPRSLIFDNPSIFSHRHIANRSKVANQIAQEKPMIESNTAKTTSTKKSKGKEKRP